MDDSAKLLALVGVVAAVLAIVFTSGPHCAEGKELGGAVSQLLHRDRYWGSSLGCAVAEHNWSMKHERDSAARLGVINDTPPSR